LKKIGLLFSGQGAQYVGMGQDLTQAYPQAQTLFHQANALLGSTFSETCFSGPESRLTETRFCQPALYVHGLALLHVLKSKQPHFKFAATAGLSLGEFTAHAAAGTFDFKTGLELVAARGALMQEACEATAGGMVTLLGATEEQARQVAAQSGLELANLNCPGQIVLSGDKSLIPEAVNAGQRLGLRKVIPLKVAGAYHSKLMAPAQTKLRPLLENASLTSPSVPVFSNVTGRPVTSPEEIRSTLAEQVTGSVLWQTCVEGMIASGINHFIELGPGKVLAGLLKRIQKDIPCITIGNAEELEGALNDIP
jgi:[acyl-carrier-protein] S-malonyltransferase